MAKRKDDNSQVIQSKKWLTDALLALMEEKPFGQITIKDIAERADLDRRTFYRHFKTKEDILDEFLIALIRPYLESTKRKNARTERELITNDFEFLHQHIGLLRVLKQQNLSGYVLTRYSSLIQLSDELNGNIKETTAKEHFRIAFKTGGFWNIVLQWLEDDPVKPPAEMADMILDILEYGLSSLCGYGETKPL